MQEGKNKAPIIINNQYICDADAVLHFSHHGVDYFDNININSRTQRTRSQTQYTKMLLAKLLLSRNTVYILYIMNSFFNYYPPNVYSRFVHRRHTSITFYRPGIHMSHQ